MPYFDHFSINSFLPFLFLKGVEMSLVSSLVFDIYKKSVLYLSYSDDNFSPETFEKKKKILTYILFTVQISLGIILIAMIVSFLRLKSSDYASDTSLNISIAIT
jgi:hypothetical protein